jgi:hypothetical protein
MFARHNPSACSAGSEGLRLGAVPARVTRSAEPAHIERAGIVRMRSGDAPAGCTTLLADCGANQIAALQRPLHGSNGAQDGARPVGITVFPSLAVLGSSGEVGASPGLFLQRRAWPAVGRRGTSVPARTSAEVGDGLCLAAPTAALLAIVDDDAVGTETISRAEAGFAAARGGDIEVTPALDADKPDSGLILTGHSDSPPGAAPRAVTSSAEAFSCPDYIWSGGA